MDLIERIQYLSELVFDFDFQNYLSINNKSLLIFKIETKKKRYALLYGNDNKNLLEKANKHYVEAKAKYQYDVSTIFADTDSKDDLFLLSDVVLFSNPTDIDTIIIHELLHFYINSNQKVRLLEHISESAKKIGHDVFEKRDKSIHSLLFIQRLTEACIMYNSNTKNFGSSLDAINSALRFDN